MALQNSEEKKRWLIRHLGVDNRLRKHYGLGWSSQRPPVDAASRRKQQRLRGGSVDQRGETHDLGEGASN